MNNIGSIQDRKKNPHDPLGNPVFFFKKGHSNKEISLEGYAKKIVSDCLFKILTYYRKKLIRKEKERMKSWNNKLWNNIQVVN